MKLTPIAANQTEVELANGTTVFFSYKTPVAARLADGSYVQTDCRWSRTTSKHIGQWLGRRIHSVGKMQAIAYKPQSWFDSLGAKS